MTPKYNKTTPLQKGLISGLVRFHDLTYTNRMKRRLGTRYGLEPMIGSEMNGLKDVQMD